MNNFPIVEAQMMIRKPANTVFNAIVDPAETTNFWFTKSSGKLETGKTIIWEWEMYAFSTKVLVKEILENKMIVVEWNDPATIIEFNFSALSETSTYVVIRNYGFNETGDALLETIKNNTGGFTTVLDGMKAWLEHNIKLNLIADKFPKGK